MSIFDIVLVVIIVSFGLYSFWKGIVRTVVSLVGSLLAIYLATRYYAPASDWLVQATGWNPNFSRVLMFVIAFILINRLVVLAFWLLNKVLTVFTGLPVIRALDRLAGLAFGLLEGGLAVGIFFYFIARFPVGETFMGWVRASSVVPYTVKFASLALPLVPEALKALRSTIEGLL